MYSFFVQIQYLHVGTYLKIFLLNVHLQMMTLMLTNPDILVKFLPNVSSNVCFMKTQMSTPFMKARVFAARVFQATLWIFLDCQSIGAGKLIFTFRKINIPVWELRLPYLHISNLEIGGSNLQKWSITVHNISFLRTLLAHCASYKWLSQVWR